MTNYSYLAHHGIKNQKWGIRRWQNEDGSLTPEGYIHYGYDPSGRKKVGFNGQSANTVKERIKQGGKLGLKAGAGIGALGTGLQIAKAARYAALYGAGAVNPVALAAVGAITVGTYVVSGYLHGVTYGVIAGSIEQSLGEKYIESRLNNSYNSREIHNNIDTAMRNIK